MQKKMTRRQQLKNKAWNDLCTQVNAASSYIKRESKTLQNVWKNIKAQAKADSAFVRRERIKTGGGPPPILQEQTELVQSKCKATFLIATTINLS